MIQKCIREFYTAASFNLSNFFQASKDGEADNMMGLVVPTVDTSKAFSFSSEIHDLAKANPENKNTIALAKCLEVIQKQVTALKARRPELATKINLLVRNTAEDVRRVRLSESTDLFTDDITQSVFEEKDSLKRKFLAYLQAARTILKSKKEMHTIYQKLESELVAADHMLEQYGQILDNIQTSMRAFILPELARRREFDRLNKEFTGFYYDWVNRETEAREKFFERGELDQLPYAFKKLLVAFVLDNEVTLVSQPSKQPQESVTLEELRAKLATYFDTWTKPADSSLQEIVDELKADRQRLENEVQAHAELAEATEEKIKNYQVELFKEMTEKSEAKKTVLDLERQLSEARSQLDVSTRSTETLEIEVANLKGLIEKHRQFQEEVQNQLTASSTDLSRFGVEIQVKDREIMELRANLASLESKLAITEKAKDAVIEHLRSALQVQAAELATLHEKFTKSEMARADAERRAEELSKAQKQAHQDLIQELESVHQLNSQIKEKTRLFEDECHGKQAEMAEKLLAAQKEIESYKSQLEEAKFQAQETKEILKKFQEHQMQVIKTKSQESREISAIEKKELQRQLKEHQFLIELRTNQLSEARKRFSVSASYISEQEENIKTLIDQISQIQTKIEKLESEPVIDEYLDIRVKQLESDLATKDLIIQTIEKERDEMKEVDAKVSLLEKQLKTQAENYEAKVKILQSMLACEDKVSPARLIEIAKQRLESKIKEDCDKFCKNIVKKVDEVEKRGKKAEESVKNMLRNNQMGILLKCMNN